jgi:hypothetical protein
VLTSAMCGTHGARWPDRHGARWPDRPGSCQRRPGPAAPRPPAVMLMRRGQKRPGGPAAACRTGDDSARDVTVTSSVGNEAPTTGA